MNILFGIIALVSIVYYGVIVSYAGLQASFSLFWLAFGIFMAVLAVLFSLRRFRAGFRGLPPWIKVPILTTVSMVLLCFAVVECMILFYMLVKPEEKPVDYLVVLGAQVRGDRITKSLRYRLDAAYDYLEENPDTKVIVTGGQGPGENISEAAAMRGYLLDKGIERDRIIMERNATSTEENLTFSRALIADEEATVGIVTNGFHVFRSVKIAEKQGMRNVTGIAAKSDPILLPNYMVREFFAVLKDKFVGNI